MPAPHFVQVGESPVFLGDGTETLGCVCGRSVLVAGYRPGSLLGIGIQCFRCGEVTVTRSLPPGAVLPPRLRVIAASGSAVPAPLPLPPDLVLASDAEVARLDSLARPADAPAEPLTLSMDSLAEWETAYDRISGGGLQAHRAAVLQRSDPDAFLPACPLAWALCWLRRRVEQPGWTWFTGDANGTATAHLLAFRHWLGCWSRHPLFPAMTASAAAHGFSLHAMAVFAGARAMAQSGNRVAFAPPPPGGAIDGFAIGPPDGTGIRALVQRFGRFEWPYQQPAEPPALRSAVQQAMAAAQGRIHLKQAGLLILSPGAVRAAIDQSLVDAIGAVLRSQGRRQRGLTAIATVLPRLSAGRRPEQVRFAWSFYPMANPHQASGIATHIGSREDFSGLAGAVERPLPA